MHNLSTSTILALVAIICGTASMTCSAISIARNPSVKQWILSKKRNKASGRANSAKDNAENS